jgi:putative Mg2+ transporter-C (MgtC) family protein
MDQIEHLLETLRVIPHAAALALAYVLALPIGWGRERNERSAGLRTFPLVAVASCGFVQATEGITGNSPEAQARIIEGLITGIGFIGGGAIIKQSGNLVLTNLIGMARNSLSLSRTGPHGHSGDMLVH